MQALTSKAKVHLKLNVEYQKTDKNGNIVPLFSENILGKYLLKKFRQLRKDPITKDGKVKPGKLNKLAAFGLQVPGITGNFQDKIVVSNVVTDTGKAAFAGLLVGVGAVNQFTRIGLGTGTNAASASDTALQSEIVDSGLERAVATASRVTTDSTNDTAQLTKTFTATGSKVVTESGIFNSASGGDMGARQVFSAKSMDSGDLYTVTWKLDIDSN